MTSKTSRARVLARERERRAYSLRLAGATLDQIAEDLGVVRSGAHRILTRVLARLNADALEDAETWRDLEAARLEALFATLYPAALAGDLDAVDRVLRVMDRRARLLGLDHLRPSERSGKLDLSVFFKGNTIDADYAWQRERDENGPRQFGRITAEQAASIGLEFDKEGGLQPQSDARRL